MHPCCAPLPSNLHACIHIFITLACSTWNQQLARLRKKLQVVLDAGKDADWQLKQHAQVGAIASGLLPCLSSFSFTGARREGRGRGASIRLSAFLSLILSRLSTGEKHQGEQHVT